MKLEEWLPEYQFVERHSILIDAPADRVFDSIRRTDLSRSLIVKLLFALRGIGRKPRAVRVGSVQGFTLLEEDRPRELVIGLEGPFWKPNCKLRDTTTETFREPQPHGTARGAWNFAVAPEGARTRLSTETRVRVVDAPSRRKFRAYWFIVRPFSGLIRRLMLRAIRDEAMR